MGLPRTHCLTTAWEITGSNLCFQLTNGNLLCISYFLSQIKNRLVLLYDGETKILMYKQDMANEKPEKSSITSD